MSATLDKDFWFRIHQAGRPLHDPFAERAQFDIVIAFGLGSANGLHQNDAEQ